MNKEQEDVMDSKIEELLADGSIIEIDQIPHDGWVSNVFLVEKCESKKYHMIVNLRPLNRKIRYVRYKVNGIEDTLKLIKQNYVLASLDIYSAFSHICFTRTPKIFGFSVAGPHL